MKTSSNNNNIESNNQEFFTKGKKYRCIKSVKGAFRKGRIYEPYLTDSHYAWFRNDKNKNHTWPQPAQIPQECKAFDNLTPEGLDPRLYFEPVSE